MLLFVWCMFHHLLLVSHPPFHLFCANRDIHFTLDLSWLHKWYPNYGWTFHVLHNQPWCCSILLQLMRKKLRGFRFLMEMEPGLEAFSLRKMKKKLLAHGTLLHFRWIAQKGHMNWIIHIGDWCHPFYDGIDCRYGSHHEVCSFLVWPFAKDPALVLLFWHCHDKAVML